MIQYISFEGLNFKNKYIRYFVTLKEETYIFIVRWSDYCECAFLTIKDYNDNDVISGRALTNNLKIRTNKLPYVLYFVQKNNESYDPTIDTIEKEFILVYDDSEENK